MLVSKLENLKTRSIAKHKWNPIIPKLQFLAGFSGGRNKICTYNTTVKVSCVAITLFAFEWDAGYVENMSHHLDKIFYLSCSIRH